MKSSLVSSSRRSAPNVSCQKAVPASLARLRRGLARAFAAAASCSSDMQKSHSD
eukprot:CAMPEP_0197879516 /NCGR_PEP_ID=MMETSP1439-20131203/7587_1 /TAXON_ID=66791 /ORGANISM="Gonyaulax spinifera, Strain CCMP409" /LENGTH=53 /DNA_ID=CAMNT_0043499025 /DNA_START=619 /DNA_END=777 /DNA_ORIENTATION=+